MSHSRGLRAATAQSAGLACVLVLVLLSAGCKTGRTADLESVRSQVEGPPTLFDRLESRLVQLATTSCGVEALLTMEGDVAKLTARRGQPAWTAVESARGGTAFARRDRCRHRRVHG